MTLLNRRMLLGAGAAGLALGGLSRVFANEPPVKNAALVPDPDSLLDLPRGFSYRVVSRAGDPMSDGLATPARFDGMAAFRGPGGRTVLVRNHELWPEMSGRSWAPGAPPAWLRDKVFSADAVGGTSTLVLDRQGRIERSFMSLAGTHTNCAGGPTPWGSWLTCEEPRRTGADRIVDGHGWVFEVPSAAREAVAAVPLKAMGRFNHEAAAVCPKTGVVYLSEDREDGALYRFIPNVRGKLAAGGRLQGCAVRGTPDSANWDRSWAPGTTRAAAWVDLAHPESPDDDLRLRTVKGGGTRFVRGEGLAIDDDGTLYLSCTEGGANAKGQIFRYRPTGAMGGEMTLLAEPRDRALIDMPDNMCIAPWGGLVVCEDGGSPGNNFLRLVTPEGAITTFARNAHIRNGEFCGVCFSPDGKTMFVNVQTPGFTFAVTGPWRELARA
jgi:secreted PhoX family phosphatase